MNIKTKCGSGINLFEQIWVNVRYGEVALRVSWILPLLNLPSFFQFRRRSVPWENITIELLCKSPYTTGNVTGSRVSLQCIINYSTKLRIWARRRRNFLGIQVCFGGRKHTQNAAINVIFHIKLAPNQSKCFACGGPKCWYGKLILSNFRIWFLHNQLARVWRIVFFCVRPNM